MFWSDQETKSKPLAEKIRQHFLNHNVSSYRSPPVDLDTSSDTSFDLSNSFEQAIQAQRTKSAMHQSSAASSSSSSGRQRPTETESHDASAMCRMLNGLELANAFTEERVSPCKLVGLTRPSTIAEESLSNLTAFAGSSSRADGAATSYATAISDKDSTDSLNFTRDSLHQTNRSGVYHHFDEDSLNHLDNADEPVSSRTHRESAVGEPTLNECGPDDTLEDVEYDHNGSKYILRPMRKTKRFSSVPIDSSPDNVITVEDDDSEDPRETHKSKRISSSSSVPIDMSPENVITVHDDDSDDPTESSYQTARTHVKTEASGASHAGGADDLFKSHHPNRSFYSDESDEHLSVSMHAGNQSAIGQQSRPADCSNIISLIDSDSESDESYANQAEAIDRNEIDGYHCRQESTNSDKVSLTESVFRNVGESDLHDRVVASISNQDNDASHEQSESDVLDADLLMPDRFNDTIERMDFMMEHGRRIQQSDKTIVHPCPLSRTPLQVAKSSPFRAPGHPSVSTAKDSPKQPLFGTPLARDSPILKTKCTNSPTSFTKTPSHSTFKKPMPIKMMLTPGVQRKLTPNSVSRIPKPISANKTNFDHIRSPIGAYISQTAPNPVRQNLNPTREFLDSTYCAGAPKGLDYTLPVDKSIVEEPKPRYSKTIYIQAKSDKITDKQTNVLPGDQSVQKLIGSKPLVVVCRGMINTTPPLNDDEESHTEFAGEQFASYKLVIGDLNVLDVYGAKE